jgi:competence protein ComEC
MIGAILGILPVALLQSLPPPSVLLVIGVLGICGQIIAARDIPLATSALALGFVFACLHGDRLLDTRVASVCELQPVRLEGIVSSLPQSRLLRSGDKQQRFEFTVLNVEPHHCGGPRTVLLSYYAHESIQPGDHWIFDSKLKRPWGTANPGSFNVQAWYAQMGFDGVGSIRSDTAVKISGPKTWANAHHRLRYKIGARLERLPLSGDTIAVLKALSIADKSGMDTNLWQLFQTFGVNHLLVVSGLHIGLVAAFGFLLGTVSHRTLLLLGCRHNSGWIPGMASLICAFFYAMLAGFSLAASRALIMLACFLLASIYGRSSASSNNLLLAAFVILLLNPLAGLASGFWLSFGIVAWLLWSGLWGGAAGLIKRAIFVHVGISCLMIPLGGWWFGGVSVVSALANFVLVPLVGFALVPCVLIGVALLLVAPFWGVAVLIIVGRPLEFVLSRAEQLGLSAHKHLFWEFGPSAASVLLALVGLTVIWVKPRVRLITITAMLCLPALLPQGRTWDESTYLAKLTVLDVGQGTSVIFQSREKTLIYDTGGGDPSGANMASAVVLPYLSHEGISALDTLIVSHGDNDHSAGAALILADLPVQQFLYGNKLAGVIGGEPCVAGRAWAWSESITFQFLSPGAETQLSRNNASCVLQIQVGDERYLLPGDIDSTREREIVSHWRDRLASQWLLGAHHGSRSSSSRLWLKYVQPKHVVFSSGYANPFKHPVPEVIQRLEEPGSTAYLTQSDGAIEFFLTKDGVVDVKYFRREYRRYWL